MKKSHRAPRDPQPLPRGLSNRELAAVAGGTDTAPTKVESTAKLGNKVWQDDWLAPV